MNITNDKVTEYINGFYVPQNDNLAELRAASEKDRVPIILKETESILRTLLELKKPEAILEIGAAVGYSASFFASVCPAAKIATIEKDEMVYQKARDNIKKLGFEDRVSIFNGDGEKMIEFLRDNGDLRYDFVFIDAAKSHYKRFLEGAITVCKPGALIVSDNILMKAMTADDSFDKSGRHKTNIRKMREYVEFINDCEYLSTSIISCGDGLALSIYTPSI